MKIPKIILTTTMVAVLTACGGGGGDTAPVAVTPVPPTTIAAVEITPPAATIGTTPVTATTAGILPTLAFSSTGTTTNQDVSISGTGTTSVMTFTSPAFTLTGATSSSPVWSANGGMTKADGNVVLYCSAGQTAYNANSSASMVPYQQGVRLFISANLTAVSDVIGLMGNTYTNFDCAGNSETSRFNADGTMTRTNPDGSVVTLTSAQVAQFFSVSGFTGGGGSNYKFRAYKYTTPAGTRYFISEIVTQVNPTANFVTLAY